MTPQERSDYMVSRYGEVVSMTDAGKILNRDRHTVKMMVEDGRLDAACGGTMVDVYSIARYICQPAVENRKSRMRKQGNPAAKWAV